MLITRHFKPRVVSEVLYPRAERRSGQAHNTRAPLIRRAPLVDSLLVTFHAMEAAR